MANLSSIKPSTNSCKKKVEDLHGEFTRARHFTRDIIGTLVNCGDNTNLTEEIGIFARQMPEFNILAEQRVTCLALLRKICTGEMQIEEAIRLLRVAEQQLTEALQCINL